MGAGLPSAVAGPDDAAGATAAAAPSPVGAALARADAAIKEIVEIPAEKRTFQNTIGALDDIAQHLDKETGLVQFLGYVSTDAAVREAGQAAEEQVGNWQIEAGKREDLYKAVSAYADTKPKLGGEEARLLEFTMRDYRRAGMALPAEKRKELLDIQKEVTRLGVEFSKNIADDETVVMATAEELKGAPKDFVERLPRSGGLCLVGMSTPIYTVVQEQCENEKTRQEAWLAYKRRAGKKNVAVLEKILKLRAQAAQMLGYADVVDYETEVRMAKNEAAVREFYAKLRPMVREKAERDFEELQEAKRRHTGDEKAVLRPWDYSFYKNVLLREKYAVDSEKVREYFPMEAVVEGLFKITQSLYGLEYRDATAKAGTTERPLWHPDVKLYEVYDKASGKMLGEFYIDLYPRDNKYSHAAQWPLVQHKVWADGHTDTPLAALVCNFPKPTPEKPSLMAHRDVETFFHEFGHCLHTILSEAHYNRFAGTTVERDFVEAPSQMFENWVWSADVLKTFARHYKTGEPLPKAMVDGMLAARYLGSGIDAEQQFYYGLTDIAYHSAKDGVVDTTMVGQELFGQVTPYEPPAQSYYQASFTHLVGYQAGYYGYMWSLVYACDMFQRFKELGMLSPEAGKYYREKILSRGGTMDGLDLVRGYLGREPKMDAFLEHLGLTK
jgi:thimet oligopeptidase